MKKACFFTTSLIFGLFICSIPFFAEAQITDNNYNQLDSLFQEWNTPNHPGGVIGMMQDGKTVFLKSYGLASIEYLAPNSTETVFNIASVSKQFTAMAVVLLQQQGKLSVDDDIRKHIPELPDFGEVVTIRHMLQHTSGLRSFHALLALAGWRGDDYRSNEDLYRLMEDQNGLNFKPGEQFNYCNTGYILMAKIIENITGESFRDWMKQNIFDPLGMINTYVEDQYNSVVSNNATSYHKQEHKYYRAVEYWGYVGSGNMHSTVNDLLKWMNNYHSHTPGWEEAFETMQTQNNFNNGQPNDYAFGIGVGNYKGLKRITHGGSIGAFRSFVCSYPEQKTSIAILTNFSAANSGNINNQVSDIILSQSIQEPLETKPMIKHPKFIKLSQKKLKEFEADYWNTKDNYARKIYLKDDTLRYFRSEGNESPLVPLKKSAFQMLNVDNDIVVEFEVNDNGLIMKLMINSDTPQTFRSFDATPSTSDELKVYVGEYFSPELKTSYFINLADSCLSWHHAHHGTFSMTELKKEIYSSNWPLNLMKFKTDNDGKIIGFRVSNGRVMNLWFEKRADYP